MAIYIYTCKMSLCDHLIVPFQLLWFQLGTIQVVAGEDCHFLGASWYAHDEERCSFGRLLRAQI